MMASTEALILAPSANGTEKEIDTQAIAHVDVPPAVRLFLQTREVFQPKSDP
jgi:hypothetical protein